MHLPLYEQLRILAEQKYPQQIPAVFRVPFYGPALRAIREYYRSGNDAGVIDGAAQELENSGYVRQKIDHNVAVLEQFRQGKQAERELTPVGGSKFVTVLSGLDVRFTPDLMAKAGDKTRFILYNFRAAEPPKEIIRTILELAHVVLGGNDVECEPGDLEFVSVRADRSHRISAVRSRTVARARQNAKAILQLWPTV